MRRCALAVACLVTAALLFAAPAGANDQQLKTTLATWSKRIAADAQGLGTSTVNQQPRLMIARARDFRADAIRAQRAIASIAPSSPRGRRAKASAIDGFRDYAKVGREWRLMGQSLLQKRLTDALRHARNAANIATRANRELLAAARLLA